MAPTFLKCLLLLVFLLTVPLSTAHFHQAVKVEVVPTGRGVSNEERARALGGRTMAVVKTEKLNVGGTFGFAQDVDEKEFVAFNADYRGPRHHPPKNN